MAWATTQQQQDKTVLLGSTYFTLHDPTIKPDRHAGKSRSGQLSFGNGS